MRTYDEFDTVPLNEDCSSDRDKSIAEAKATIKQIERQLGLMPFGFALKLVWHPHDGPEIGQIIDYPTIRAIYNDDQEEHIDYLNKLESSWPENWDEESRKELGL